MWLTLPLLCFLLNIISSDAITIKSFISYKSPWPPSCLGRRIPSQLLSSPPCLCHHCPTRAPCQHSLLPRMALCWVPVMKGQGSGFIFLGCWNEFGGVRGRLSRYSSILVLLLHHELPVSGFCLLFLALLVYFAGSFPSVHSVCFHLPQGPWPLPQHVSPRQVEGVPCMEIKGRTQRGPLYCLAGKTHQGAHAEEPQTTELPIWDPEWNNQLSSCSSAFKALTTSET